MKIIFSPAKKMKICDDHDFNMTVPVFEKESLQLREILFCKSYDELKQIYKCSSRTLDPVYQMLQQQKQGRPLQKSPALLSYEGIAFRYMAPDVFDDNQWAYVNEHLRILSAMYGILKPQDGICAYRLEMQSKLPSSLYEFWSDKLAKQLKGETIINLASVEYSKTITPYAKVIDVHFFEEQPDGLRKEKGVYAKMARGAMVRYMAEHQIEDPKEMQSFADMGFAYDPLTSTPERYDFVRQEQKNG